MFQTTTRDIVVKSEIKMKNIPNAQLIMWTIKFFNHFNKEKFISVFIEMESSRVLVMVFHSLII